MIALLAVGAALAGPVDLSARFDATLVGPAPDAVCRKAGAGAPVEVPIDAAGTALRVTWVVQGVGWAESGQGAAVTVAWADGQTSLFRAVLGEQLSVAPTTGPGVRPVVLGVRDGAPVVATEWTIPLGDTGQRVARVTVEPRGRARVCLAALALDADPVPWASARDAGWYPFAISGALPAPLPQALPVEAPAGGRGFVRSRPDGRLEFADGTRARFWGVNVVGLASVPARADADAYAQTLAAMGFNLVRIHHFDGPPARGVANPKRTGRDDWFVPERLDDLDFFVSRLKAHGVYLLLEIATEHEFVAPDGVADPGGLPNGHKLAPMFQDDWNDAWMRWTEAMWGRVNPYTGLRYADDPVVAMVELSNEHSLLMHWGFGLERLPAPHLARLDARWNAWLLARHGTDEALARAWGGLAAGESLAAGTVSREPAHPAMFDRWPPARRAELHRFYAELELRWYQGVEAKVREMGFRVPTIPSINYNQPILQLLQEPWAVADLHVAYDHVRGTRFDGVSAIAAPDGVLDVLPGASEGRALVVSELSHPAPNPFRAEGPLLWAALASAQDWDALVWFSYADAGYQRDTSRLPGTNDIRSTPVTFAQMPTASSLFRSGAVPAAEGREWVALSREGVEADWLTPDRHTRQLRDLPWAVLDPRVALTRQVRTTFAPDRAPREGAPGPVGWYADDGVLVVDTPRVQARVGPPGPVDGAGVGPRAPGALGVELDRWAAVALACVEGEALDTCARGLLTVGTTQENHGTGLANAGRDLVVPGIGPAVVAPARGEVRFRWSDRPEVWALDGEGRAAAPLVVRRAGRGWWSVRLDDARAPWFEVRTAR